MPKCSIVIDLGFGDAGKGATTHFLASQQPEESLVVRFSGGHQVGHTVTTRELEHTFSNFGSGTVQGVPTYYSAHTTLFPPAILQEGNYLKAYQPKLYVHPLAKITTIYDIAYNRAVEKQQGHGSCGLGFGATIARDRDEVYFYANDLQFPWVIQQRLQSIQNFYQSKIAQQPQAVQEYYTDELQHYDEAYFIESCLNIKSFYEISQLAQLADTYQHFIFEGSQGILLDTQHGFHPHTTWSATTSKNAIELILTELSDAQITMYYVTRCYQTRHGNGPMSSKTPVTLINNAHEANVTNEFQGEFRTRALDPDLLNYALSCDAIHQQDLSLTKNLVVTCLDQLPDFSVEQLLEQLSISFTKVYGSFGPRLEHIKILK
ncbi:adenylosuccinate synthase [Leeuwenhoekiella aestuarii]|uniref:Adenylosuccinate synthase n=1 Tax=Leeuwenhoekiella aestuarii TaxID=2249426 RepID=A0A4Q0NP26_9FLAO|nr:adenylosuccinate synthetase [Leeuwenhoekiella aestuarii]RXG11927.1 adenylosuccinate synthase [Leeuwenhoekiella aestuarii]RXG13485.1 adenylosuccinate synthase [Leeuwenhoekiella aestuarii]